MGVNAWVVHRDASIFGDDVEAFRPERWLGEKTGDMSALHTASILSDILANYIPPTTRTILLRIWRWFTTLYWEEYVYFIIIDSKSHS